MRRPLSTLLAFTIGLGVSFAAFTVSQQGDTPPAPGTVLGQPDVAAFCRETFGDQSTAVLLSDDAFGWRCVARQDDLVGFVDVDISDVCRSQFQPITHADTYDEGSPFTWQCVVSG